MTKLHAKFNDFFNYLTKISKDRNDKVLHCTIYIELNTYFIANSLYI